VKKEDISFRDYILDQLASSPGVKARPMFGGYGLYEGESFFGIISEGELYFKTNASTRPEYEAYEMTPFQPSAKQILKNYYQVPPDILEDSEALTEWAKQASLA